MFTGIVEGLGALIARNQNVYTFSTPRELLSEVKIGDSIAVNGCCLTVVAFTQDQWSAHLSDETLARTNLGQLNIDDLINLELPMRLGERLGGHLVQGHVDTTGTVIAPVPDLHISLGPEHLRYVIEKGSIAVNGVSLTIVNKLPDGFTVVVIPHTATTTNLSSCRPGDKVNIEVDLMAKYAESLLPPNQ